MGDLNSHINTWVHEGPTDIGGRQLLNIIDTYPVKILNEKDEFTCVRKNRDQTSLSLIDWTMATNTLEVSHHHTMNEYDMFSDHIPIKFQIKVDYTKKSLKNEINTLWNNLNNEWA